jgi:preprotein translocase subunit SecE
MSAPETLEEKRERRRRRRRERREDNEPEEAEVLEEDRSLTAPKGRATPGRRQHTEEVRQGNAITRPIRGFITYLRGVQSELEKVTWPTREETRRLTLVVIAVTIASAIVLGLISLAFGELVRIGVQIPAVMIGTFVIITIGALVWMRRGGNQRSSF